MHAAAIIDALTGQVGTDASRATVLAVLNEAYAAQCADSRWFRTEATIGPTVVGTAEYTIPAAIVEMYAVSIGGYTYEPIGEDVMRRLKAGSQTVTTGRGGVYSQGADASGNATITLHPTPTTAGAAILVYAATQPTALTDSSGSNPITPVDTHSSLIDGTAAILLSRIDERPDLAGPYEQRFAQWTEKLRRRRNSIAWGAQPVRMGVQGYHFA